MTTYLERLLFFFLILLLPSQLAYHFWPDWSFFQGLRIDYLSPSIYLTDLLILSLLAIWLFRFITHKSSCPLRKSYLIIICVIIVNSLFALSPAIALIKWVRLIEYMLFSAYFFTHRHSLAPRLALPLAGSLMWTSLLAWLQFFAQSSLGGVWTWLGERPLSVTAPTIAKISLDNFGLFLRPYATFPHPNALAAFLLLGTLILLYLFYKYPFKLVYLSKIFIIIPLLTIPLTFSRSLIFIELAIILYLITVRYKLYRLVGIIAITLFLYLFNLGDPNSFSERIYLTYKAFSSIALAPLTGIGLNNFILFPYNFISSSSQLMFQPVHNIYLLIAAELGIPMIILLSVLIIKFFKQITYQVKNIYIIIPLTMILITGFIDHYWLTSPQNMLLICLFYPLTKLEYSDG